MEKYIFFILYFFLLLFTISTNNTYALGDYKECIKNNNSYSGYKTKILCDNNYYLYYKLKELHDIISEIIQKFPTKISIVKNDIANILIQLNDNKYINVNNICKYFFTDDKVCSNGFNIDIIKSYSNEDFISNFNLDGQLNKNIIKTGLIINTSNENDIINIYSDIQEIIRNFNKEYSNFINDVGYIFVDKSNFGRLNVLTGTNNIDLRLKALSKPDNSNENDSNIKHFKIGLLNLFKPFFNLSYDIFIQLPFSGRFIGNPYIIVGIFWYKIVYTVIIIFILFTLLSALIYPVIEVSEINEENGRKEIKYKRRNIWLLMTNSKEFNLFEYLRTIFFTNNDYKVKYDISGTEITIKNEYRTPLLFKFFIKQEYIGLGFTLMIRLMIFLIIQGFSNYLIY